MKFDMPRLAGFFGLFLVALGLGAYYFSGQASLTALIPVPFGIALAVLAWVARRTGSPKHPIHAAAVLALLGFFGSANGIPEVVRLLAGDEIENPLAVLTKTLMAVAMAAFLVCCIQSFRQARR